MKFSHPLARSGSVWPATTLDDKAHDILVIVTDARTRRSTQKVQGKVERLRDAGKQYIRDHVPDVREVVLMNPVKG